MKIIILFFILSFWNVLTYSQNQITDKRIKFTSEQLEFIYTPNTIFSKFSIATIKFSDGQQGIEIFLISKHSEKPLNVKTDSIIFQSATSKRLVLNKIDRDTIFFLEDGGLSLTSIFYLNKNDLDFMKQELITSIIVIVDTKQHFVSLRKKSQIKLRDLLNSKNVTQ